MQQNSQKRMETIGLVLAGARNQAGLSQEEIARQMNLMVSTVRALEEDDFVNLPGPTYVRGYLHTYSKLVGLDAGQLIRIYDEQHSAEPEYRPLSRSNRRRRAAVLWTAAIVIALAGAYVLLQGPGLQPSAPAPGLAEVPGEPLARPEEALEIAPGAPHVADTGMPVSVEDSRNQDIPVARTSGAGRTGPSDEAGVQAAEQRPAANGLPVPDGNLEVLTMTFMSDCWIEIRDADMQLLLWDLMRSGAALEIEGKAPFEVLLGNSPGVVIHIDGKRFDHSGFHQSDRTSRFKVSGSLVN